MPHNPVSAAGAAMPAATFIQMTPRIRRSLEALVDDLILFLDEIDGDVDIEPDSEQDVDIADEPHDEHDQDLREHSANESYGRGFALNFGPCDDDAEDGCDQEHASTEQEGWLSGYCPEQCEGLFGRFKGGKLASVRAIPAHGGSL